MYHVRKTLLFVGLAIAAPAAAQDIAASCAAEGDASGFCERVGAAAEQALPRAAMAAMGANAISGSSSTLGMRLAAAPRWAVSVRATGIGSSLPPVDRADAQEPLEPFATGVGMDLAVGVLQGMSPLPTVGGVGSLDVMLSASRVGYLGGRDFAKSFWSWGGGARLGVLRESFTTPGVSVSARYRRLVDVRFGDPELQGSASSFGGDVNVLSARATAGKTILLLSLTGGVGWDRLYGNLDVAAAGPLTPRTATVNDWSTDRFMVFGNVSYTLLVLNFALEAGWQEGAGEIGATSDDGEFFGGASMRLTI